MHPAASTAGAANLVMASFVTLWRRVPPDFA